MLLPPPPQSRDGGPVPWKEGGAPVEPDERAVSGSWGFQLAWAPPQATLLAVEYGLRGSVIVGRAGSIGGRVAIAAGRGARTDDGANMGGASVRDAAPNVSSLPSAAASSAALLACAMAPEAGGSLQNHCRFFGESKVRQLSATGN